ncbi:IclR family transcriptional regulator [Amycolatopsis magusensis]|uniref:DNA-binding IclR family transcriptional regulator n=1 Tax=Amycolatopsis magusensis TaxID=882444 RepID=A0ABS4PZE0_9PSEU|nr:IclR family transcriptional regulator [Amycolatopsis magusensis]MBP2184224.1 DNA-binding IclR family transcriptional regulator [Amycolatopsis magusensis]
MPRVATGESVLTRVVRIIEVFTASRRSWTITEIARAADLPIATTSRLVAELVGHGLLAREPDGRVSVGMRLWELAQRASPALSLREAAMPFLEDVHHVVGHHVQLSVLDGDEVLFVERLSAPGAVINYTDIAGRLPLHASSSGLVLLAYSPPAVRQRILGRPLRRYTGNTIADPDSLRRVLAAARRSGHVIAEGHIHAGATGVAVPIRGSEDTAAAALSVIVPRETDAFALVPVLRTAARAISRALDRSSIH